MESHSTRRRIFGKGERAAVSLFPLSFGSIGNTNTVREHFELEFLLENRWHRHLFASETDLSSRGGSGLSISLPRIARNTRGNFAVMAYRRATAEVLIVTKKILGEAAGTGTSLQT